LTTIKEIIFYTLS